MKKVTEAGINVKDDRDERLAVLESQLAKLNPPPSLEVLEPYAIGSEVYSVADVEGSYGLRVLSYEHSSRRIIVTTADNPEPRSIPVVSVRPLEKCPGVQSDRMPLQIEDPTARTYWEGRRAASAAAKAPPPPPPAREPKFKWAPTE